jgi:transformer-2 protein
MRRIGDAQVCVDRLNGVSLHGRTIRVDFSATAKPHNPTPGEYMGTKRHLRQSYFTHTAAKNDD